MRIPLSAGPLFGILSFYYMQKHLNIMVELVERYACGYSKVERSKRMTVLSFAIWCKMQHSNSVIFRLGTRRMMDTLHISQPKAKLLLDAIKTDNLFVEQSDGRFMVATFKDEAYKRDKKGRIYKGAKMFTLDVNKEYTLKDIYNRLNELLFLHQIGSQEANSSHVSGNKKSNRLCRSTFITMKQLQGAVGMSHGSVSGIKKRLIKKGQITSTYAELHMADKRVPRQVRAMLLRFGRKNPTFEVGDNAYVCIPCTYAITNRDAKRSCGRHIIYGYIGKRYCCQTGETTSRKGAFKPLDAGCNIPD